MTIGSTPTSSPSRLTWPRFLLIVAVVGYAAYFSYLTLTRFAAFESRALDMGNLNQAIWNTAHGDWFRQTNQPGVDSRLSLHVEPILLPIAALYRLIPGQEMLLVLQSVIVAAGAIAVYALGEKRLRLPWLALIAALTWLMSPAIQSANWLEFHPVTLAPTFLLAAFYFLLERRGGWYAFFAVLAAASKEDIGLLIFMMGLYALIARRWRWAGTLSMVLGLGWSLFAVLGIQQVVGGNIHWWRYGYLGDSPSEMMRTMATQPSLVVQQLRDAEALRYVVEMLLPVGFVALLAPEVLLLALPSLAINLLADFPPMHETDGLIYAAPIAPFVVLAAVMGIARLQRWTGGEDASSNGRRAAMFAAGTAMVAGALLAQAWFGYLPGGANFRLYEVTDHHRRADGVFSQISAQDAVSSQDRLNAHVSGRYDSWIFPEINASDTVVVDVTGPSWPQHPNDVYETIQSLLADDFGIAAGEDGYLLLKKDVSAKAPPPEFYSAWLGVEESPTYSSSARFGDELDLLGYDLALDAHDETVLRLFWRATSPPTLPYGFLIRYEDGQERLFDSTFYQPVSTLWYPTDHWPSGETVLVQSLPWDVHAENMTVQVGLFVGDDSASNRLPITGVEPWRLQEGGTLLHLGTFEQVGDSWAPAEFVISALTTGAVPFGEVLTLEGAALGELSKGSSEPFSRTLPVALDWRTSGATETDYNVYVHLKDEYGRTVAQVDTAPRVGLLAVAMTQLPSGMEVAGGYPLAVPQDLAPGAYEVVVGVYDWQSGVALPIAGSDSTSVSLGQVGIP